MMGLNFCHFSRPPKKTGRSGDKRFFLCLFLFWITLVHRTPQKTNMSPKKVPFQKERTVFQLPTTIFQATGWGFRGVWLLFDQVFLRLPWCQAIELQSVFQIPSIPTLLWLLRKSFSSSWNLSCDFLQKLSLQKSQHKQRSNDPNRTKHIWCAKMCKDLISWSL